MCEQMASAVAIQTTINSPDTPLLSIDF